MLAALRSMRQVFAGTIIVLLATVWLSQAAAACIDIAIDVADTSMTHASTGSMMDHASMGHASTGDMPAGHDCPHCAHATSPCMDAAADCDLDPALLPASQELPKFIVLPELPRIEYPVVIHSELPLPHFISPPCPAGRELLARFCTLQE